MLTHILQVLRNISGINPKTSESMAFEHGKNTLFAGAGLAKTMINQGVRVYEVAFWVGLIISSRAYEELV
jgi:hypothetical protein